MTNAALSPERDFFISYTRSDRPWAEWIGWILEAAGYSVFIDAWDFRPGANFVTEMDKGTRCRQTIAVLSQAYLDARYTKSEWAAAFADDPQGDGRKLIPVRIEDFDPSGLLKSIVYVDFVGVTSSEVATERLLQALKERGKPTTPPIFPGELNLEVTADPSSERKKPEQQPRFPVPDSFNPFLPLSGGLEDPSRFFNCKSSLNHIFELLNSGSSVALIGRRNMGKSSTLWAVKHLASERLQVPRNPIRLNLAMIFSEQEFYEYLCKALNMKITYGTQFIRAIYRQNFKLLLLLDNLERMKQEGFTYKIRQELRVLAEGSDAPLKLVLTARRSLDYLFPEGYIDGQTSPFEGITVELHVPSWSADTCRDFISSRLASSSVQFSNQEIAQLVSNSDGNPQKLTRACHALYTQYCEF
ncbi:MAG: TIR domain-containing protein [Cyanobacteria bacterium P01_C01_bin.120]